MTNEIVEFKELPIVQYTANDIVRGILSDTKK
jgi:hypothetical protein